jgi:membrane protease YdiL (CAAX protease family)
VGHSTDPFPLFVLSLFLGFVYQRTHRILPSIILHATFNLISMVVFWQTMFNK